MDARDFIKIGMSAERTLVVPAAGREARVNCMIGEKIWQDRWGR